MHNYSIAGRLSDVEEANLLIYLSSGLDEAHILEGLESFFTNMSICTNEALLAHVVF